MYGSYIHENTYQKLKGLLWGLRSTEMNKEIRNKQAFYSLSTILYVGAELLLDTPYVARIQSPRLSAGSNPRPVVLDGEGPCSSSLAPVACALFLPHELPSARSWSYPEYSLRFQGPRESFT